VRLAYRYIRSGGSVLGATADIVQGLVASARRPLECVEVDRDRYNRTVAVCTVGGAFFNLLGTGKSTSMNNVTRGDLLRKPIPLPPVAEQAAIVERVNELMTMCCALDMEIKRSRNNAADLLQAVLKEAFAP
jgi:hypothetical protein